MNPIKFLFEKVKFLGFETEILEACDWDEERAKFVTDVFQKFLAGAQPGSSFSQDSPREALSASLNEKEVEACICILERCMIDFSLAEGEEYEN
tara:strand:+ start:348 stop:629 length:282 start_codon:yes stop_codon:yes gene_type:complete